MVRVRQLRTTLRMKTALGTTGSTKRQSTVEKNNDRPNVTTVKKNNVTTCSGRQWRRKADWGFPGIIDRNNFRRHPCPVKLTNLPYKALKLKDGTYGVLKPVDLAGVWYRDLLNEEWDRTAVSFARARRRYFEWFRNREAREARRKNHRLEKVAYEVLTRAGHRHALLCVSPNQMRNGLQDSRSGHRRRSDRASPRARAETPEWGTPEK